MKDLFLLTTFIIFSQVGFAQIKIDEYLRTDSDSEAARLDDFTIELIRQPESKGLIIIYVGENKSRLGNVLNFIEGIKSHFLFRQFDYRKVDFVITESKEKFFKEFWIIPKGKNPPEVKALDFDLSNLQNPYYYAYACLDCEPAVPGLSIDSVSFRLYAEVLKENLQYKGLIIIYNGGVKHITQIRKLLVEDYKVKGNQVKIRLEKRKNKVNFADANFYLIPKTDKNKKK